MVHWLQILVSVLFFPKQHLRSAFLCHYQVYCNQSYIFHPCKVLNTKKWNSSDGFFFSFFLLIDGNNLRKNIIVNRDDCMITVRWLCTLWCKVANWVGQKTVGSCNFWYPHCWLYFFLLFFGKRKENKFLSEVMCV